MKRATSVSEPTGEPPSPSPANTNCGTARLAKASAQVAWMRISASSFCASALSASRICSFA